MSTESTFQADLNWEQRMAREPWCEKVCREFFRYFRAMELVEDITRQRQGIDRIVTTYRGNEIRIDDKMDGNFAENLFLEYRMGRRGRTVGWLEKDAHTDYLLYAFVNEGLCYFIPFQQLQSVWFKNKDKWIGKYNYEKQQGAWLSKGAVVPIREVIECGVYATEIKFER